MKRTFSVLVIAAIPVLALACSNKDAGTTTAASTTTVAGAAAAPVTEPEPTTTTTEANSPKITKAEFDQITTGMTLAQVEAIIGGPGEVSSEMDLGGDVMITMTWDGPDFGDSAILSFQNGTLSSKTQFGLK